MITCTVKYILEPKKLAIFEDYARVWIALVNRMGGNHHGYFVPGEGANNIAYAFFSFPSFADYEQYRLEMANDSECQAAIRMAEDSDCILSYERSFMKPILDGSLESIQTTNT